jgi:hypothetical protein
MCFALAASCSLLEPNPRSMPDYDNRRGFILDYAPGDCFVTLKTMFLTRPTGTELDLAPPGLGAPSVEQYTRDPTRFRYVVKVIPPGTHLKLVAIKNPGYNSPVTFVQLEGSTEWAGTTLGEYTKVGVEHHLRYNREYFRKVGGAASVAESNVVSMAASRLVAETERKALSDRFAATPLGAFLHAMAARRAAASGPVVLTEQEKTRLYDCIGPGGRRYFCGKKVQTEVRADWPRGNQNVNTNTLRFTRLTSDGVYVIELDYTLDGEFAATGSRRIGP